MEKEDADSRFRSTNTALCAEKGESASSFSIMKTHFAHPKVHSATVLLLRNKLHLIFFAPL